MPQPEALYEEHARGCDDTDFWGQVRRTVDGKPVPEEQITLIVAKMTEHLDLRPDDILLDICCGNGALSARFFRQCAGGLGIDYSETLVSVARRHFEMGPSFEYMSGEALGALHSMVEPARFTKALIYGSINYFSRENAEKLLAVVRERCVNVSRLVIGNVADLAHIHAFFGPERYEPGIEDKPDSAIGAWWSRDGFSQMAARAGWSTEYHQMPEPFYARHYRFDALLRPV